MPSSDAMLQTAQGGGAGSQLHGQTLLNYPISGRFSFAKRIVDLVVIDPGHYVKNILQYAAYLGTRVLSNHV